MNPTLSSSTTLGQSPPDYASPDEKLHDSLGDIKPALPNPYLHLNQHPLTTSKHPARGIRFSDPRFNFLSHASGHIILFANRRWPSAEHLYQALKFASPVIRRKIRHAPSPDAASLLAKRHTAFVKPDWLDLRLDYARAVIALKVAQHPDLAVALLSTGEEYIINDVSSHPFWGRTASVSGGQNQLGRIWCEERARLTLEVRMSRPNMVNLMVATRKDLEEE